MSLTLWSMGVQTKRVQESPRPEDGARVLVDRYWPRGVQRAEAGIDLWLPELGPSPVLIAWFGRKAERWDEFVLRYRKELASPAAQEAIDRLRSSAQQRQLTLLYGTRHAEHAPAQILADYLRRLPPLPAGTSLPSGYAVVPSVALQTTVGIRYVPSFAAVEWLWLVLGLSAPLIAFTALQFLVVSGSRGRILFLVVIAVLCAATFARIYIRERRTGSPEMPLSREDAEPIWAGLATFGFVGTGVIAGVTVLCLLLGALAYLAGYLH